MCSTRQRIEPAHDLFELGKPIAVAINRQELVRRSDQAKCLCSASAPFAGGGRQALPLIRGGRVEIGEPRRVYTIEPLEDPVPREEPEERPVEQPAEPLEPELPRR
jgi:hypothetical protein